MHNSLLEIRSQQESKMNIWQVTSTRDMIFRCLKWKFKMRKRHSEWLRNSSSFDTCEVFLGWYPWFKRTFISKIVDQQAIRSIMSLTLCLYLRIEKAFYWLTLRTTRGKKLQKNHLKPWTCLDRLICWPINNKESDFEISRHWSFA